MNRLSRETSPYLLQHAHNPVDWYPWGEEALRKAQAEDKPILVSIGYSACHWCHVMERESFEDEETARLMNAQFINIKIDREERPDLDHIYMDAVQAMTGSGGWPLNVFLTPDAKPFYGGTYFPPIPVHSRASWRDVLTAIAGAFREKRKEIEQQAEYVTSHAGVSNPFGIGGKDEDGAGFAGAAGERDSLVSPVSPESPFKPEVLRTIFEKLMELADRHEGGFGRAPKFPQTFSIQFLLHYYHFTKEKEALQQACLSLDKMIRGGIYDQLGGGFARYSTDGQWLAPHFEKMLYDNALLVIVLSEAYQLTGSSLYRAAIMHTMDFIGRELSNGEGGFYAALDADSEGEEGKYYVWDKAEIDEALGEDAPLFCHYYGVTERGNWEGKNILVRKENMREGSGNAEMGPKIAEHERLNKEEEDRLERARVRMLESRSHRVRPGLDDKTLLGWNALVTIAYAKAYGALGVEEYRERAVGNISFCRERMRGASYKPPGGNARDAEETKGDAEETKRDAEETKGDAEETKRDAEETKGDAEGIHAYFHSYKNGQAKVPAFLDDYAYLIAALMQVQEITGNADYLLEARDLTNFVLDHFSDENGEFFYYTHEDQGDVILRKKEVYDGATPSGNSMMAWNLRYLSIIFDMPAWAGRSERMTAAVQKAMIRYPSSFGIWATLFQALTYSIQEIVVTGRRLENARQELLKLFIPYRVVQSSESENTQFPLLSNKRIEDGPLFYLCKNYSCQLPVNEVTALLRLLENV